MYTCHRSLVSNTLLLFAYALYGCQNDGQAKARNEEPCSESRLLKTAMSRLPEDQRFPCDPRHVMVIRDIVSFLKDHSEIANRADLRWKAEHAMAFTIGPSWPVYMFAGVLAHEIVRAAGNLRDGARITSQLKAWRTHPRKSALADCGNLLLE